MRDFTRVMYKRLLEAFLSRNYPFCTFSESITDNCDRYVILRHDVDKKPENALETARIENSLGIKGSYYFRAVNKEREVSYINAIAGLGHEIGYHYEDLSASGGDMDRAIESFRKNLCFFRQYYPVNTICMHGAPLSKYDNRLLWSVFDYRSVGIIAEPYFDIDVTSTLYLSDTGRRWDGIASIRDRAGLRGGKEKLPEWTSWAVMPHSKSLIRMERGMGALHDTFLFKGTEEIIKSSAENNFPSRAMFNIHPQRWEEKSLLWLKEAFMQSLKNSIKRLI